MNNSVPRRFSLTSLLFMVVAFGVSCGPGPTEKPAESNPRTIVFVHGAWGGGWQYKKVQPLLEEAGYTVYRPTMTGLGERVHLARPDIGLSTHIEDIVEVLEFEELYEIVLVGHSYGGMVIAGVAERVPERIAKLVYFDAILPEDGESVMIQSLPIFNNKAHEDELPAGVQRHALVLEGGGGAEPWELFPRWVEEGKLPPVDVPQPLLTFTEPIRLGNPEAAKLPAVFLLTVEAGKEFDDFDVFADRARNRGWGVVTMEGTHNPHWFQPENFVRVLLQSINS